MIYILTSAFHQGFTKAFSDVLRTVVTKKENIVFIASEFERFHEKTDGYCARFLDMFRDCGIEFAHTYVVDSRMSPEIARKAVASADVLWLEGGDTPTQYYIQSYGLIPVIRDHKGITIGMSAGSINMANTAICTLTCKHREQRIYPALGLVDITVEPHFNSVDISEELIQLSQEYPIFGMCDDSAIIFDRDKRSYIGEIYWINKGIVKRIN